MPDISQAQVIAGARALDEQWPAPPSKEDIARRVLEAAGPGIAAAPDTPDEAREYAFEDWYMNVILGPAPATADVAHKAFCSGWEAARRRAHTSETQADTGGVVSREGQDGTGAENGSECAGGETP